VITVFFLIGYFRPKPGGIKIDTTTAASVYINGALVGSTPYNEFYPAGEITLKLVPEGNENNLVPFEIKVNITSGIQTVVERSFGSTEDASSDYVISFDKNGSENSGLVVVSRPENAEVEIDGVSRGFAPYEDSTVNPGLHAVTVKAPGYADASMTVSTVIGYRLTFFAKLEKGISSEETQTMPVQTSPPDQDKPYVQIQNTPTGYLRVRSKPGLAGVEIAQVSPGDKFPYLDEDVATGWLEIQYQGPTVASASGVVGWVSGDFAKKVMLSSTSTPSAGLK